MSDTKKQSLCERLFSKNNKEQARKIYINESIMNTKNTQKCKNIVKNQKYNWFTLVPLVILYQFTFFSNQFYLFLAMTQVIDIFKVGLLFTYVSPLAFVLAVTLIKEFIDDYYRYKRDQELNSQLYETLFGKKIQSKEIRVGDTIIILKGQRIPADMILLKSFEQNESCFIKTDQLDGETDWKLRKPCPSTQKIKENLLLSFNCEFEVNPPTKEIYEFSGILKYNSPSSIDNCNTKNEKLLTDSLGLDNTLWANTVLASSRVVGLVIYTGKETRTQMNCTESKPKVGILDYEINNYSKILFVLMFLSSLLVVLLKSFSRNILTNLIYLVRFVVLISSIIPISLKVNLDIAKTVNSLFISKDNQIPETICRNSTLPEELGRVEFIFSDKTGTLTKNEMIFKKLYLDGELFENEKLKEIESIIADECQTTNAPMMDIFEHHNKHFTNTFNNNIDQIKGKRKYLRNRNQNKVLRDTITAMCLCNCVTPVIEVIENTKKTDDLESTYKDTMNINTAQSSPNSSKEKIFSKTFQASSPDEIALVEFATSLNMRLESRDDKKISIVNANNVIEEYEILAEFPFTSESKRMGIIVRNVKYGHIIFYLKGAENVIENFVKEDKKQVVKDNAEQLAMNGLRTLVLTQKLLTESFYLEWNEKYQEAKRVLENRNKRINEVIHLLEKDMEFLCVTGVEDLLQDDVYDTVESLKKANIKIWMLTGDKVETAKCISISTGLKSKEQREYIISNDKNINSIGEKINDFKLKGNKDWIFIIDGDALGICLEHFEKLFFETVMCASSVVCCRCSPTQKAQIVKNIRKYSTKRTLSIGDGGNDVPMIQEANLGVGIVGKEGMQASLAADYSITKFCHLKRLLLWYGRISYKNTSNIVIFVIHRGLIISLLQLLFSIIYYFSPIPLYNGFLMLGYSTLYTNIPVLTLLLDVEISNKDVMKFPDLYRELQKGRSLNIKAFLLLFFQSLFQASVIMIGSIYLFNSNLFLNIVTITFSALIILELLNVYTEITTCHWAMFLSIIGTLLTYLASIILFRNYLDVSFILEDFAWLYIFVLTLVSWFPFFFIRKFYQCLSPNQIQLIKNTPKYVGLNEDELTNVNQRLIY